jgi:hypothetical protein
MSNPFDGLVAYQKIRLANAIFNNTDMPTRDQFITAIMNPSGGLDGVVSFSLCNDDHYDQFSSVSNEAKIALIDYLLRDAVPGDKIWFHVIFCSLDKCLKVTRLDIGIQTGIEQDGYTHS